METAPQRLASFLIVGRGGPIAPASWERLDRLRHLFQRVVYVSPIEPGPWFKQCSLETLWVQSPWGNRNRSRNRGLDAITTGAVYLLDEDVRVGDPRIINEALEQLLADPQTTALAGPYLNSPEKSSHWSKAYNESSNAWSRRGRFLAGHVLLKTPSIRFDENLLQGGEEAQVMRTYPQWAQGLRWSERFEAEHLKEMTFFEFLKKARAHGLARGPREKSTKKSLPWEVRPAFWPGWILFQAAVEMSSLYPRKTSALSPEIGVLGEDT